MSCTQKCRHYDVCKYNDGVNEWSKNPETCPKREEINEELKFQVKVGNYSTRFDKLRQNRTSTSYYKYGSGKKNFPNNVDALATMQKCIEKYKETKNTEYLCDAANYLMFEFMYPSIPNARFKPTNSEDSAGIVGMSVKEIEEFKNNSYI